jgi:hypothetical protein
MSVFVVLCGPGGGVVIVAVCVCVCVWIAWDIYWLEVEAIINLPP